MSESIELKRYAPKTVKVVLQIEAEIDRNPKLDDDELKRVAKGYLWKLILQGADVGSYSRGAVCRLVEGDVSFQRPEIVEEDE